MHGRSQPTEGRNRVGHHDCGAGLNRPLAEDRGSTGIESRACVVVTIAVFSGYRNEEITGFDLSRIDGDPGDAHITGVAAVGCAEQGALDCLLHLT